MRAHRRVVRTKRLKIAAAFSAADSQHEQMCSNRKNSLSWNYNRKVVLLCMHNVLVFFCLPHNVASIFQMNKKGKKYTFFSHDKNIYLKKLLSKRSFVSS